MTLLLGPLTGLVSGGSSGPVVPSYAYEWNPSGDGSTWVDITGRVLGQESYRVGMDQPRHLRGRVQPGTATVPVRNYDGAFSKWNASGPYYGNLIPGRRFRVRVTAPLSKNVWAGFTKSIVPAGVLTQEPLATFTLQGPLGMLAGPAKIAPGLGSALTSADVGAILDLASWPAGDRAISTGDITAGPYSAASIDALSALRVMEDTELGLLLESNDHKMVFQNRGYRGTNASSVTSQATFSDASGAALGYETIEPIGDDIDGIANSVSVAVAASHYATGSTVVVSPVTLQFLPNSYTDLPISLPAGQSITLLWTYTATDGSYVNAWITPTLGSSGSDIVYSGGSLITTSGGAGGASHNQMNLTIQNTGGSTATITQAQARGTITSVVGGTTNLVASDATSITNNGLRTWSPQQAVYDSNADAQTAMNYALGRFKDGRTALAITFTATRDLTHFTQAVSRVIGDRITIVATGASTKFQLSGDFWIEAIQHTISEAGTLWKTRFECGEAY